MCTAKSRAVAGESAECIPDAGDVRDFRAGESGGAAIWVVSVKCLSLRTKKPSALNAIDLIVCLVLILAVWSGWRRGFIVQMCSLAAIVTGIWLASRFGLPLGRCLRLDDEIAAAGGFVVVFVLTILAVAIAGRLLRKLFRFAGFGVADIVLGIIVSIERGLQPGGPADARTVEELPSGHAAFGLGASLPGVGGGPGSGACGSGRRNTRR